LVWELSEEVMMKQEYLQSKTEIDCISGNKTMKAYWWRWLMIRLTVIKWAILDFLAGR
jgi:hypothetical protein